MRVFIYFITCILTVLICRPASAAFSDTGVSPRAAAMSGAFACVRHTALDVFYNPAGIGGLAFSEISVGYGKRFIGLSDMSDIYNSYAAGAFSIKDIGSVGIGWQNLGLAGNYQEHVFLLSYAYSPVRGVQIGLTGKEYFKQFGRDAYTETDPLFLTSGYTRLALGIDAGVLLAFDEFPFRAGFVASDINTPDIGLGSPERLPLSLTFGAAFVSRDFHVEADICLRDSKLVFSAGGEGWVLDRELAIRSGFSMGENGMREASLGLGYSTDTFEFNYAFTLPMSGVANTFGSHQTGLSFRFGDVPRSKKTAAVETISMELEEARLRLVEAEKAREAERTALEGMLKAKEAELAEMRNKEDIVKSVASEIEQKLDSGDTRLKAEVLADAIAKAQKEKKSGPRTYRVQEGDNLKIVAEKFYKDGRKWELIYNANKEKVKGGILTPGTELTIPPEPGQ